MSRKGLSALFLLLVMAVAPVSVAGQEIEQAPPADSQAPAVDRPLVLEGQLDEGAATCLAAPMLVLGESTAEAAGSTLQVSFCMCDRCVCSACDCSAGIVTVRCCALALGSVCVAVSTCDCLQC